MDNCAFISRAPVVCGNSNFLTVLLTTEDGGESGIERNSGSGAVDGEDGGGADGVEEEGATETQMPEVDVSKVGLVSAEGSTPQ